MSTTTNLRAVSSTRTITVARWSKSVVIITTVALMVPLHTTQPLVTLDAH